MNDAQIRSCFHHKKLRRLHAAPNTLVVDELGLKHGRCKADIAVINSHLIGYEIKSNDDSLHRLAEQVNTYNAVFDRATVVLALRHLKNVQKMIPCWWGITAAMEGQRGAIHFETVRRAALNPSPDEFAVAQLLWRNEAEEELAKRGTSGRVLKKKRSVLYRELVDILDARELRDVVRVRLKNRISWRCPERFFRCDGLSRPCAR